MLLLAWRLNVENVKKTDTLIFTYACSCINVSAPHNEQVEHIHVAFLGGYI